MLPFPRPHLRPVLAEKDSSLLSVLLLSGGSGLEDMKKGMCGSPIFLPHGSQVLLIYRIPIIPGRNQDRPGLSLNSTHTSLSMLFREPGLPPETAPFSLSSP